MALKDLESLSQLWHVYQKDDIPKLIELAKSVESDWPFILPAVLAHKNRMPTEETIGLPKETLKRIKGKYGTEDFGIIFKAFQNALPIYGFGDLQVKRLMDEMISENP